MARILDHIQHQAEQGDLSACALYLMYRRNEPWIRLNGSLKALTAAFAEFGATCEDVAKAMRKLNGAFAEANNGGGSNAWSRRQARARRVRPGQAGMPPLRVQDRKRFRRQ